MPKGRSKTTFIIEWGCFQYTMIPFRLKKMPTIFSHVVLAVFKEFIHQFLEVYFDHWTVFRLVQKHVASLQLMMDMC